MGYTKAELLDIVEAQSEALEQQATHVSEAYRVVEQSRESLSAFKAFRYCPNGEGEPICVKMKETDIELHIYSDEENRPVGFKVSDGTETVFAAGLIPAVVLIEEIDWAGR